jgi:hypothetical protein
MLQRTVFLYGLVKVPVMGSRFLATAAFMSAFGVSQIFSCKARHDNLQVLVKYVSVARLRI